MAGFLNTIGLASEVLGIVSFALDNAPEEKDKGASVSIRAGLGDDNNPETAGTIQSVFAFDFNNDYLGMSDPGIEVDAGEPAEFTIDQEHGSKVSATYLDYVNDDDGICITYISVAQPDGLMTLSWMGDIGKACGQGWYHSSVLVGRYKDTKEPYYPACTWLDGNLEKDSKSASMKINMEKYLIGDEKMDEDDFKNNDWCDYTVFSTGKEPISERKRSPKHHDQLIVSSNAAHNATQLCESATSRGPDFVSVPENVFCDMDTHTAFPICSPSGHDDDDPDCVHMDLGKRSIVKRGVYRPRDVVTPGPGTYSYKKVDHW